MVDTLHREILEKETEEEQDGIPPLIDLDS